MNPENMELPEASDVTVARPQQYALSRIWKVLYACDPARIKKIGPELIDEAFRHQLKHEIRLSEINMQFEQQQLEYLRQIEQRI